MPVPLKFIYLSGKKGAIPQKRPAQPLTVQEVPLKWGRGCVIPPSVNPKKVRSRNLSPPPSSTPLYARKETSFVRSFVRSINFFSFSLCYSTLSGTSARHVSEATHCDVTASRLDVSRGAILNATDAPLGATEPTPLYVCTTRPLRKLREGE